MLSLKGDFLVHSIRNRTGGKSKRFYQFLLILGIVFIAINLRPGMTSVGPLVGTIRDDIGLSNWSAGLITSLPLLAFAAISSFIPALSNRFTNERMMMIGLMILTIGISIRSISVIVFLFGGTILVGIGIAICNVILPSVVKDKFPLKVALMTSIYSTVMGIVAAIASGISIPIAITLNWGWQLSLLIWIVPAIIGFIIWGFITKENKSKDEIEIGNIKSEGQSIWRSPLAWQIALFMGLQSTMFYVTISWLPEILHAYGLSISESGWLLSYTQIVGMPASFIVPMIAGRLKSQQPIVLLLGTIVMAGYLGLLLSSSYIFIFISITLIGITLGGGFALALTFLGIRARHAKHAAQLSGMAQAIGYSLAAIGPVSIGLLYDISNGWKLPLIALIIISILGTIFGLSAGKDKYVLE